MNENARVLPSILIGWAILIGWTIAVSLLVIGSKIENTQILKILLWNVHFFAALAGNGPLLGYDVQGNPMYEGTPVHLFFGFVGILSSFTIYPIILFLVFNLVSKIKRKNTKT